MQDVIYLKHPVSAEQKADCKSKGLKILDERFKPAEAVKPKAKKK